MPDELYIRCLQLTKVFKDFWLRDRVRAVDAIDLDVRRGEVFGLLGPNGSGKSTTIKMILGLLHPTSGRIAVLGKVPRDVSIKEHIGYLPEESYLYKFLNARETLEYYGKLFHQNRRKRQRRIDMLLEMVGLDQVQRRPIGEYSKGMQRRIGLAQALINDPKLLVLDEPTTGMDPIGTKQIKDLIVRLKDAGKTVLLCSHLLADVEDVTDRCAIMFGGKVRRAGAVMVVSSCLVSSSSIVPARRTLPPNMIAQRSVTSSTSASRCEQSSTVLPASLSRTIRS
ncbi:MAG: ABC transporter ATP-binding protein, partial [Planctomycetota bacterium]